MNVLARYLYNCFLNTLAMRSYLAQVLFEVSQLRLQPPVFIAQQPDRGPGLVPFPAAVRQLRLKLLHLLRQLPQKQDQNKTQKAVGF